ncbi:PhoX family protein [Hydrogenophaga sp.]|uniref:PhoX family protein n=1 Tax=Hydrogenophaga sp. TaxID=1904254 RepID=UPI00391BA064
MAHHPIDDLNPTDNEHFQDVLAQASVSRRHLIRGGVGLAALGTVPFLAACGGGDAAPAPSPTPTEATLGFNAVGKSLLDEVKLPAGYTYSVVHATGDRLVSTVSAYSNTGAELDAWEQRVGDHHDGMDLYYVDASGRYSRTATARAVLAMNHESSADSHFWHPHGQTSGGVDGKKFSQFNGWDLLPRPELEVLKEINHHGVSIAEVRKGGDGKWTYVVDAPLNRRVNGQTVMRIAGPAAHLSDIKAFMVTAYDPSGATSRGTLNNCGHGKTPWGTYLACEENWAAYFFMPAGSVDVDAKTKASRQRYGVIRAPFSGTGNAGSQGWSSVSTTDNRFTRFNVSAPGATAADDFRQEPNTFGYIVEIDPLNPTAQPAKRVAMGRFAHEAAVCGIPVVGQPLAFYMGCDSQNEYVYKFVSSALWSEADIGGGMVAGDKYLNEGKLYVAKFKADGTGEWIELNIANPLIAGYANYSFANQADVLVNTRLAADAVGATKMDRPEWGAVNPKNGEVYFTMTNNSSRTVAGADAANPRAYADNDGRLRSGNPNGHIIRLKETGTVTATATGFRWDIFLFGAEEDAGAGINLSGLSANNDFSSPDGLWFSPSTGICWIQTDDGNYTDATNCMLLAAIPGSVGDGASVTVNNSLGGNTASQQTFIGAALGDAKLRRFLVGPKGCEVTGITETADGKTLFVNIQHPGENTPAIGGATNFTFESQWPSNAGYGPGSRPRSATIAITRTDGGVIGR